MLMFFILMVAFIIILFLINLLSAIYEDKEFKYLREELEKDRKE